MTSLIHPLIIVAVVALYSIFGGCSGGDNRDYVDACENGCPGGEDGAGPASYIGPTSYATIDRSNVQSLVAGAFFSGQFSQADNLRTVRLPLILSDSARLLDVFPPAGGNRPGNRAVRTEAGSENGSCGGSFEFILSINDAGRAFSGSVGYSKYCDQGITVSGNASVQGTYDTAGQVHTIEFLFANFSDDRVRMEGEIAVEFTDMRIDCYLDFYAEDRGTGKVAWIDQSSLYIYELADRVEFEFYGNYYDPDNGYVQVETTENFSIYGDDQWPSIGSLLIQGKDNATAELVAIDRLNCLIKADLDGDNLFDFESEILNWESFFSL